MHNKFRSVIAPEQLVEGDIIQFNTQGTALDRRKQPLSYGYVHQIEYNSSKNDDVESLRVLPIIRAEDAQGGEFRFRVINHEAAGPSLGLDPNKVWATILAPLRLLPTEDFLGRRDNLVQRLGNISNSEEQKELLEKIENLGGEEHLSHERFGGPRMARPSASVWGLYAPVGVKKDRFEESEYVQPTKRQYRKKPTHEGLVLDLDIDKAVAVLALDQNIAAALSKPADKRLKPVKTLRDAFELVNGDASNLERYLPKGGALKTEVKLADLEDEIHIGVINGLAEGARKGKTVKPITDLSAAYELITQRPHELPDYVFMGPVMQQRAKEGIKEAYESRVTSPENKKVVMGEVATEIKSAWRTLTNDYLESLRTQNVPERYLGEDMQPVWKLVPKPQL